MKSLQGNIIWENLFIVTFATAFVIVVKLYGLAYLIDYITVDAYIYNICAVVFIFLICVYGYFRIYSKVGGPVTTLSENFKNALSSEWSKIYPVNSNIKEFQDIEKLSLYLMDMARNGLHTNSDKLLELKETQKQFLNKKFTEDVSKFKLAIDSVLDVIVLVDKFGYINYANKALTQLTGIRFEDAENKKITDLWHKDNDPEIWKKNYEDVLKSKKAVSFTAFGSKKDNVQFEAAIQIAPVKNTDDSIDHFLVVERDIT